MTIKEGTKLKLCEVKQFTHFHIEVNLMLRKTQLLLKFK
jgi:hypothetical protein